MATMETISEALKLIPQKRSLLRQAFEDLLSHSSFSLSWSDVDSHFSALQATAEAKFKLLQSQPPDQNPNPKPQKNIEPPPLDKVEGAQIEPQPLDKVEAVKIEPPPSDKVEKRAGIKARSEVKVLCEKMDGLGLRNYISLHRSKERHVIGDELPDAFRCASDAAAMVLDALECFVVPNAKGEKDLQLVKFREACIVMFKGLMDSKVEISPEVRERAKKLALDWKERVRLDDINVLEPYGFLYLVAIYGLVDIFSINDLFDMAVIVATRFVVAAPLIRVLPFGDKIPELIQKIINKGKQLQAVRYVLEFELAGKFPPVALLQDFVNEAKKNTLKTQKDGTNSLQSLNDSIYKETTALKTVLNLIKDHKIEGAEFLKQRVIKRIEGLEMQKARRKKKKPVPWQAQDLSGAKRPRVTPGVAFASSANIPTIPASATTQSHIYNASPSFQAYPQSNQQLLPNGTLPNVASTTSSTVPSYQQSYLQLVNTQFSSSQVASLPNTHTQYPGSQVAAYGSVGATSVIPYANSSDGALYGSASSLPNTHTQYSSSQVAAYGSTAAASVTPYANSSDGTLYGSAETSIPHIPAHHSDPNMASGYSHQPDPNMASGYYTGSVNYGGYAMPPQHHPSYQPQ